MKYTKANLGRIFVLRLENGDIIPDVIEKFAEEQQIKSAIVHFIGGADQDSKVVVGADDHEDSSPQPIITDLAGISESVGVGTLFVNEKDKPVLHLHSAFGRKRETITGCTRKGVNIWNIGEVVIQELIDLQARRKIDPETGFELLEIE